MVLRKVILGSLCLILAGCVTTEGSVVDSDTTSGWSFHKDTLSKSGYAQSVVKGEDGHPVRSGEKSIRFEVRKGDCRASHDWNDCTIYRERSERTEMNSYHTGEKWYHWSIYLPKDPSIKHNGTMMGQFKNKGTRIPVWEFRVAGRTDINNKYYERYVIEGFSGYNTLIDLDDMRGKWTDVLIHVKWHSGSDGFLRAYVNGNIDPVYVWEGNTKNRNHHNIYFKFGIYRTKRDVTSVAYYDDVRRGSSCEEVTSYFDCSKLVVK